MKEPQITVEIRKPGKPGAIKAYADVSLNFPDGELHRSDSRLSLSRGNRRGLAFRKIMVRTGISRLSMPRGRIRDQLIKDILSAYEKWDKR